MRRLAERQKVINTKAINIYDENIIHFWRNSVLKYTEVVSITGNTDIKSQLKHNSNGKDPTSG